MSTAPAPPTIRSLYRRLLRELPSRAHQPGQSLLSNPSPVQQRIRTSLSHPASGQDAGDADAAEQFVQYLRSQRVYATLLERYNPGMNMDEEEKVRLTARRVGMDLPIQHDDGKP